jgi:hypothetical protein
MIFREPSLRQPLPELDEELEDDDEPGTGRPSSG